MKRLTTKQVVIRIAVIISAVELLIMLLLSTSHHEVNAFSEAFLDTTMLAIFSTPAIYIWVIKPFVKARDEALAQVNHLALTDPLTQLANRRLITKHLEKIITGSSRHDKHGAVLLIDLDGFKLINDKHGHEAGDAVLVETAERLRSVIRSGDIVGRLGGDEFVVLINRLDTDKHTAHNIVLRIAENLIDQLNKPFNVNSKTLHIGASIGIRLLGSEKLDMDTAMSEADIAMYRAKEAGKGGAVFFEKEST